MYTYCIWDFNGTVLDDVELGIYSINLLMANNGIDLELDKEKYRARFGFPIIDYYKELGFDFEKKPYDVLAKEWVDIYMGNLPKAKLFPDLIKALEFFKNNGVKQSILSASEKSMLKEQVADLGVSSYFEEIMGIDNIYADSKLSIARRWFEEHPGEKVLFVGDTTHDIETARALGADCCIVCAGHQCKERFSRYDVKVFDSLTVLVESLEK